MTFVKSTLTKRVELLTLLHPKAQVVEVGVYKGYFAKQFIPELDSIDRLFLVDPWNSPQCEGQMVGSEEDHTQIITDFHQFSNVHIVKDYSQRAVNMFNDNSLDLVYLDAEHTYDGLLGDINLWYSKVKKGGILAGHDVFAPEHIGVTNALCDIFACPHKILSGSRQRPIFVIPAEICPFTEHTVNPSWYVVK
jgi:predicted O-methyltransferase YrrM